MDSFHRIRSTTKGMAIRANRSLSLGDSDNAPVRPFGVEPDGGVQGHGRRNSRWNGLRNADKPPAPAGAVI